MNEKTGIINRIFGEWNTKTIVLVAIGSALFGLLLNFGGIPIYTNTKLSLAYLVPIFVGVSYGALPAGLVGLFGNIFADLISGAGFWPDWWIGNLVSCFVIGLALSFDKSIERGTFNKFKAILFSVVSLFGIILSFAFVAPTLNTLFYGGEEAINFAQGIVAVVSNGVIVIVLGIPFLFYLSRRNLKQSNLTKD